MTTPPQVFRIGEREVGIGRDCLIIGEVAQSHDGSLGMAHAFVDAIAGAGADAVKFQTHIAEAESTPGEPWRVRFSQQDASRYEYWKRMEFTEAQWAGLAAHAHDRGLVFLSSPFSIEAVDLLDRIGMKAWKIASGEVGSTQLMGRVLQTRRPVLLSTGLTPLEELDVVVARVVESGAPVAVLQCTTAYPSTPETTGLNVIGEYRERYGCPAGLSDHSGTVYPSLGAAALGVEIVEVHVALSREMFGPDVPASVTTSELRQLVDGVRFLEQARRAPMNRSALTDDARELRRVFGKNVVARVAIPGGTTLQAEHMAARKAGGGIPASELPSLVGRRVRRAFAPNEPILEQDVENQA